MATNIQPDLAETSEIEVASENEDKVVIINAQNVLANASDFESNEQDTVIPVEVDGQHVAVVDTNFDDDYSITVVDDVALCPPELTEDHDINLADYTPEVVQDAEPDYSTPLDYMPDNDNINNF